MTRLQGKGIRVSRKVITTRKLPGITFSSHLAMMQLYTSSADSLLVLLLEATALTSEALTTEGAPSPFQLINL